MASAHRVVRDIVTTQPDPRPQITVTTHAGPRLVGARCLRCGYRTLVHPPRCARCLGPLEAATFGPSGTVWSSTVVRIPVPGRTPPYALAYVDIDDGPRVLAHLPSAPDRVAVGARVTLAPQAGSADLTMEVLV